MSRSSKVNSLLIVVSGGCALFASHQIYTGSPKFYSKVAMPLLQTVTSAETAHNLAIKLAKHSIIPKSSHTNDNLKSLICGMSICNPVGLAAGFDKHIEAIDGLLKMGFGYIEVGGVTPEPQPGNDKPRVFRLKEDQAIINRYGFNSVGHNEAQRRFHNWRSKETRAPGLVGVNLGKNKNSTDLTSDYVRGVFCFGPLADFLVVNVSSPNTPGLRKLQGKEQLKKIIHDVSKARDLLDLGTNKPPIFVKIAPDLTEQDKIDIASLVCDANSGVQGLVVSNTTITRPKTLMSSNACKSETGGLSGKPLRAISTGLIREMYKLTKGKTTIIGVGGIFTGQDALEKIKAGASAVQIYSVLAYEGPPAVDKINRELSELIKIEGYSSVQEAIGADHKVENSSKSSAANSKN